MLRLVCLNSKLLTHVFQADSRFLLVSENLFFEMQQDVKDFLSLACCNEHLKWTANNAYFNAEDSISLRNI